MKTDTNTNMKAGAPRRTLLAGLALAACLAGCATPPPPSAAATAVQAASYTGRDAQVAPADQRLAPGLGAGQDWWTLLRSPEIDAVVALALENNQDIDVARERLARAAAEAAAANGGLAPQVDIGATAARGHDVAGGEAGVVEGVYRIGPTLSYEVPLAGRTRETVNRGAARVRRGEADLQAVRLAVSGNVVLRAVEIAALRAQTGALREMIANGQDNLAVLEQAQGAGAVARLDVIAAQNHLDQDRAALPAYEERLRHAEIALTVLVGQTPAAWKAPELRLDGLALPVELPVAIPSELLRSRPDIVAADADVAAASAAVGLASADLYPRVNLTVTLGRRGLLGGGGAGSFFDLVGGIVAPAFDGGARKARERAAQADYRAALAAYRRTVATAFGQVAESMYQLSTAADKESAERTSLASAETLADLTWQGYRAGKVDYLRVLSARRARQQARLAYLEANRARYDASVTLLLAAGAR